MPILTAADKALYFPSVVQTGAELDAAIATAQGLVEAAIGRKLEITAYTEIRRIPMTRSVCLAYFPVVPAVPIHAQVCFSGGLTRNMRSVPATEWITLEPHEFSVNYDRFRLVSNRAANQASITYSAGIDFSVNTAEVTALKTLLGQVIAYTQSDQFSGITERTVDKEYSVRFGSSGGAAAASPLAIPTSLLQGFFKYRPRSFC